MVLGGTGKQRHGQMLNTWCLRGLEYPLVMTEFARPRIYIQHILPVVFLCRAVLHSHTFQSPHELRWSDDPVLAALSPEKNESHPWSWVMHSLRAFSQQWPAWLCSRHEASCVWQQNGRPLQIACFLIQAPSSFICIQLLFLGLFQKHTCSKPILKTSIDMM